MNTYELTIGDGHNRSKDCHMILKTSWECDDLDEWLLRLVSANLPSMADELDRGWIDDTDDGTGSWLCIDESRFGETDGHGGPWLVAELRRVEAEKETKSAIDDAQLDFARIWARAA